MISDEAIITAAVNQLDKEGYSPLASVLVRMNERNGATVAICIAMLVRAIELLDPEITISQVQKP